MKLLIVEDDPLAAKDLTHKLNILGFSDIVTAYSAKEAKKLVELNTPDLLIVDINLGSDESGIDLGYWLDARGYSYFYLSGKQDTVTFLKSTQTDSVINLEKPVSLSTLRNTLHIVTKSTNRTQKVSEKIIIPTSEGIHLISLENILYLKAARAYSEIYLTKSGKRLLASISLAQLMERNPSPKIIRIHRSHAVNVDYVTLRKGNILVIGEDAITLDIGRSYRDEIDNILQIK